MWFFFSIITVALPIIGLFLHSRAKVRRLWPYSLGSFLFFALLCMDELFTIRRRCFGGDFGGIEDTIGAVLLITAAVAIVALVLNAIALSVSNENE